MLDALPSMSSSFSENFGSLETSRPRKKCGFGPFAAQWRDTLAALLPSTVDTLRALQRVAPSRALCGQIDRRTTSAVLGDAPRGKSRSMPASSDRRGRCFRTASAVRRTCGAKP